MLRDQSTATMYYGSDTNVLNGTIRWNPTSYQFETYSSTGGNWSAWTTQLNIGTLLLGKNAAPGSMQALPISQAKSLFLGIGGTAAASNALADQGDLAAPTTGQGLTSGLTLNNVYNDGYPIEYGNVISAVGRGAGQLLLGWSGTSGVAVDNFVRSMRDADVGTTNQEWSPWAKIVTDLNYQYVITPAMQALFTAKPTVVAASANNNLAVSQGGTLLELSGSATVGTNFPDPSLTPGAQVTVVNISSTTQNLSGKLYAIQNGTPTAPNPATIGSLQMQVWASDGSNWVLTYSSGQFAVAAGSSSQSFAANTFTVTSPNGYAFSGSTGYYHMDATNGAVYVPPGGAMYCVDTSGNPVPAIVGNATQTNQAVTLGQLQARTFVSGWQTLGANQIISVVHNLGGTPKTFGAYLQCVTAELGYNQYDIAGFDLDDGASHHGSNPVCANSTGLILATGDSTFRVIQQVDNSNADWTGITPANWRLVMWATI